MHRAQRTNNFWIFSSSTPNENELTEMNTDSLYKALSEENFDRNIQTEM